MTCENFILIEGISMKKLYRIIKTMIKEEDLFEDSYDFDTSFFQTSDKRLVVKMPGECSPSDFIYFVFNIMYYLDEDTTNVRAWFAVDDTSIEGLPTHECLMIKYADDDFIQRHDKQFLMIVDAKGTCYFNKKLSSEEMKEKDIDEAYLIDHSIHADDYTPIPVVSLSPIDYPDSNDNKVNLDELIYEQSGNTKGDDDDDDDMDFEDPEERLYENPAATKGLIGIPVLGWIYRKLFGWIPAWLFELIICGGIAYGMYRVIEWLNE